MDLCKLLAAGLTCLAVLLPAGNAQEAAQPAGIQVPETIKLARLVDLTAEATGQQFSYNPADLDATVTLRVQGPITPQQLTELTTQVLATRGLTSARGAGSNIWTVVKLEQAASFSALSREPSGAGGFVTEVFAPRHQPAKALIESIRPLLSKPGGAVNVLAESDLIMLSDLQSRVTDIRAVVEVLDRPDRVVTRSIPLRFVPATQAAALVAQLTSKREAAGGRKLQGDVVALPDGSGLLLITLPQAESAWRELIAEVDKRELVQSVTYVPRYFAAKDVAKLAESVALSGSTGAIDDRFNVVTDELTGSLIISATATQHERIRTLMERLDAGDRSPTPVRSFPIRNRPVAEVLSTLLTLVDAGLLSSDASAGREEVTAGASQSTLRSPLPPPTGAAPAPVLPATPAAPQERRVTPATASQTRALSLTADEPTNTLIAIGEPKLLSQIETMLQTLDVRQPQVMLEVTLVSLSDSDTLTLGAELERIGSLGNASVRLASLFGLSTGGPLARTVGDAVGFSGVVLNPGEFSIVVRALETVNRGRSLSNPKVLVSNNERAVFSSTLQQPIQQQTRTGSNDTTFSYGGTENAGTTISVKPQIAQGDHLVLTYSIKLSSFVGSSSVAGLPPPKQENAVDSIATIPDGHTVVVGGLDLLTEGKGESRVPGIGRIPVIGELFKTRNNTNGRTRFFVFIRATVLRSGSFEDLKYISTSDANGVGVDDGFPEVHPRVIR